MDYTALNGDGCGLRAVGDVELAEKIVDVGFYGGFADVEVDGDLFVGAAGYDAFEDGELAGGKGLAAHAFGQLFGDGSGDAGLAGVDGLDGGGELFDGHALEEVGLSSGLQGAEDVLIAVEGGEDDEAGCGVFGADADDGVDAAESGELEVHEGDVGAEGAMEFDGFEAVAGFADDFDLGHDVEKSDEALTDDVVVVDDEDADGITHGLAYLSQRGWGHRG
jgi:hypothetical protein